MSNNQVMMMTVTKKVKVNPHPGPTAAAPLFWRVAPPLGASEEPAYSLHVAQLPVAHPALDSLNPPPASGAVQSSALCHGASVPLALLPSPRAKIVAHLRNMETHS